MPASTDNPTGPIVPLSMRPRSGPYSGLNARSAKRFLTAQFSEAGLPTPDIDARELVLAATAMTHSELIANGTEFLSQEVFAQISDYAARRLSGEPVDHILGRRGFYGRDFKVTKDVLSPRPDTEVLIDKALAFLKPFKAPRILDLGTGTGVLAITLLTELPHAQACAVDISQKALSVARVNAQSHGVDDRLMLLKSDWLSHVDSSYELIISNPPYIDAQAMAALSSEVAGFDPALALAGGEDGLSAYRIISAQARDYLTPNGQLIIEIGFDQGRTVPDILRGDGWDAISVSQDLAGQDRCVQARKPAL
ncbi:peptide chain release factor N(5)-glutamine methyltransferase [Fretibacter rubidus]|uniref:peptide chain release factor N(5)-glutamine methyltransferase n=1 Tax=Fretibacter rubidus TaxID=570162 RepID=UPI00352B3556